MRLCATMLFFSLSEHSYKGVVSFEVLGEYKSLSLGLCPKRYAYSGHDLIFRICSKYRRICPVTAFVLNASIYTLKHTKRNTSHLNERHAYFNNGSG